MVTASPSKGLQLMTECTAMGLTLLLSLVTVPTAIGLWHLSAWLVQNIRIRLPKFSQAVRAFSVAAVAVCSVMAVWSMHQNTIPCDQARTKQTARVTAIAAICPVISASLHR